MADQEEHSTSPSSPSEENRSTSEEEELAQPSSPEQQHHDDESEAGPNLQANPTTQTPNESSSESPESAQSKEETEEEEETGEEEEEEEEVSSLSSTDEQQQEKPKEQETAEEPEVKEEKEEEAEPELSPEESTDSPLVDETPVAVGPVDDGHPFHLATTPSNQQDETPEEQKSQRDLDDEEIPPPPVLSGRNSFSSEKRLSQSSQPTVKEQHEDEHHDDAAEEKENVDPSRTNGEILLEKIPFEEIEKKEVEADNEVLPPLEPTSIAQELLHDQHFVDETLTTVSPTTTVETPVEKKEEEFPWEDVLSNRTLMKQTIRKGGTNSRPTRSQLVTVNYSLSLLDEKSGETTLIEEKRNEEFFVGETDIIVAIDLAVQAMDEGELAVLVADVRHVYGNEGFVEKGIPPKDEQNDYKMQIQLELIRFCPAPNVELLSADERILWAEKKRQNGNVHYRRKEYSASLQCYRGSLRFLDLENNPLRHDSNDEERKRVVDQFIQVQNNVAQVNLTLKRYDLCLNAVENVLRVDPTNIKALFRQGKSLFELGQYDRCQTPLKTILQLDPNHSDRDQINKMIAFAEQKLANYKQNEKDIYRRMFQGSTSPTTTSSSTSSTTTTGAAATSKTPRKIVLKKSSSSNFWTFVGLSTVTVSLVGLFAYLKYRPAS